MNGLAVNWTHDMYIVEVAGDGHVNVMSNDGTWDYAGKVPDIFRPGKTVRFGVNDAPRPKSVDDTITLAKSLLQGSPIGLIKALRAYNPQLSLKDAKEMVDKLRQEVNSGEIVIRSTGDFSFAPDADRVVIRENGGFYWEDKDGNTLAMVILPGFVSNNSHVVHNPNPLKVVDWQNWTTVDYKNNVGNWYKNTKSAGAYMLCHLGDTFRLISKAGYVWDTETCFTTDGTWAEVTD